MVFKNSKLRYGATVEASHRNLQDIFDKFKKLDAQSMKFKNLKPHLRNSRG